jgi:ribosomal protein S27AE
MTVPIEKNCIRCGSKEVMAYGGNRFLCQTCGFTFHADSLDEAEELIRRAESIRQVKVSK